MKTSSSGLWEALRKTWRAAAGKLRRGGPGDRSPAGLPFVRSFDGPYLRERRGDRTFEFCVAGYGPFVAGAIAAHDREFVFLDIGANLGLFSLIADRHPLCRKVVAIEPVPAIFGDLRANLVFNRADKVVPVRAALCDTAEDMVWLSFSPRHSGRSRVLPAGRRGAVGAKVLTATGLSALVPARPVSVLAKIDVEGGEFDVLSVLRRTSFYPSLNDIVIEISEEYLGADRKQRLLSLLAEDGFTEVARSGSAEHHDALYRRSPHR